MALDANKLKTQKALKFRLEKVGIEKYHVQVGFAIDVSYSMKDFGFFKKVNGTSPMQLLNDRVYPVAEKFDDNQSMDVCLFDNKVFEVPDMTRDNYEDYIDQVVLRQNGIFNGTEYAPAIQHFIDTWFGKQTVVEKVVSKNDGDFFSKLIHGDTITKTIERVVESRKPMPSYIIFQTDGDNGDELETAELLNKIKDKNVYISFLGVGNATKFEFVKKMANIHPNVGFFHVSDLNSISDDELYEGLITDEMAKWLKDAVITVD